MIQFFLIKQTQGKDKERGLISCSSINSQGHLETQSDDIAWSRKHSKQSISQILKDNSKQPISHILCLIYETHLLQSCKSAHHQTWIQHLSLSPSLPSTPPTKRLIPKLQKLLSHGRPGWSSRLWRQKVGGRSVPLKNAPIETLEPARSTGQYGLVASNSGKQYDANALSSEGPAYWRVPRG